MDTHKFVNQFPSCHMFEFKDLSMKVYVYLLKSCAIIHINNYVVN